MPQESINKICAYCFTSLAIIFYSYVFYNYHGTGDDGDSISHYLYARWSWELPYIWINHWGKSIFTFISSPFAQFGMKGIQFFNTSIGILTAFLTYKVAEKFKTRYSAFVIPIILLMPEYMKSCFSGLTEILFAFLFVVSIIFFLNKKYVWTYVILSFLPFCRPDGTPLVLMIGFFSFFREDLRRYIPYLVLGHAIITLIGIVFFHEEWLWLITKNPNTYHAPSSSMGGWTSFIIGLLPFMGLPIYILFWLGLLFVLYRFPKERRDNIAEFSIYFFAVVLFTMHTILYKFNLFRSIGLLRYLVPIPPILGLICLHGFSFIKSSLNRFRIKSCISSILIVLAIFSYTFSSAKYSAKFPQIFDLNPTQKLSIRVLEYINKEFPKTSLMYYSYPYFSILRDVNPYDWSLHRYLDNERIKEDIPKGSILIWDNWYCVEYYGITPEAIKKIRGIREIRKFEIPENESTRTFIVYFKE